MKIVRIYVVMSALLILAQIHVASAQSSAAPIASSQSRPQAFTIERAERWTLKSKAGRIFEISVSLPKGPAPVGGYAVLYVLDADTAFATLTDIARFSERGFGPALVVGIGYPSDAEVGNRVFDLLPAGDAAEIPSSGAPRTGTLGGGHSAFLNFLLHDLKPVIEKSIPIDKSRQALFGHSAGGWFVLHVLLTRPDSFDTYVAASPSIFWSDKALLKDVPGFKIKQTQSGSRRRLLITVGGLEGKLDPEVLRATKVDAAQVEDFLRKADTINNSAALAADLEPLSSRGLEVVFTKFPDETHGSVKPAYLGRGARFALQGWFGNLERPGDGR